MPLSIAPGEAYQFDRSRKIVLQSGHAIPDRPDQPDIEFSGPSVLFLPATFLDYPRILAGGEGYAAKVGIDLIQRTVGEPSLTVLLRPMIDRLVLAGLDMLAERLRSLANSSMTLVRET